MELNSDESSPATEAQEGPPWAGHAWMFLSLAGLLLYGVASWTPERNASLLTVQQWWSQVLQSFR